ncbi:hypothetical protein R1sor_003523 [Riccia sorocarpa]|uniref:Myb/SANT-like DNA-binding domain-containing protein n=1 Tax=Riccia sorocarpa TaxID=122646 RepID=A0ABD3H3Z6_9MARC
MEAAHAARESVHEREWLPVSPRDPMYFRAPANVSSGAATFGRPSSSFLAPGVFHRTGGEVGPSSPAPRVVHDSTDTQVQSSQPLPDEEDSPGADEGTDVLLNEDEPEPTARQRRSAVSGKRIPKPRSTDSVKTRFHWHDPATVTLIDIKRKESNEDDVQVGRDAMLSAEQKWKIVEEKLAKKNIFVTWKKISNKWEKLAADFRRINDYEKLTGKPLYSALDSEARDKAKLPGYFPDHWYTAMDTFLGPRPTINPNLSQSAPNPTSPTAEDEVPGTEAPMSELNDAHVEHGTSASEFESGRHNSGKRKKDVSKSAHAILSAMNNFLTALYLENTKASRSKEMVSILSVLAGAFTDIASTFRGKFQDKDV